MTQTFVDTAVWYAAADTDDRSHRRATEVLATHRGQLVTTDHVLIETWVLARHRLGRDVAEQLIVGIRRGVAAVEATTSADLERALATGREFPDQDFSLVDRTSFSVMLRLGLRDVCTFDDDFAVFRFGTELDQAFTIHR